MNICVLPAKGMVCCTVFYETVDIDSRANYNILVNIKAYLEVLLSFPHQETVPNHPSPDFISCAL